MNEEEIILVPMTRVEIKQVKHNITFPYDEVD